MGPEEDKIIEDAAIREAEKAAYEDDGPTPLDLIEEFELSPEEVYEDAY
jgi:hypothetical protein